MPVVSLNIRFCVAGRARRLRRGLCIAILGAAVVPGGVGAGADGHVAYGVRVGSLLPRSGLDGRPGLHTEAFVRWQPVVSWALEAGAGYGRFVTRDRVRGLRENFTTDMALAGFKALLRPLEGSRWQWRVAFVPHLFGGFGVLRYDIDRLTPRRGRVAPIGWTGRVPLGLGGQYRLGAAALVIEAGYTFTFSGALDEVDDGDDDGFWGVTFGLVFEAGPPSSLVHRRVETPQRSSLYTADRDEDGLDEREETRVYFTNPLMPDSDGDGLSDGREAKEIGSDPNNSDSDGGGMDDGDEVAAGFDPLDAADDTTGIEADPKVSTPAESVAAAATPVGSGFETVFFGTGGVRLDAAAEGGVRRVAARLSRWPSLRVELRGYADSVGDTTANRRLSLRRAESVRNALVRAGIALDRLRTVGLGESDPIAPNDTPAGRSRNRRVEVLPVPDESGEGDAVDPGP